MSCYLELNHWNGKDLLSASEKLAQVFRLQLDEAKEIVEHLSDRPWKFDQQVSDGQAQTAELYLGKMGFSVTKRSLDSVDNENTMTDATDQTLETDPNAPKLALRFNGIGKEMAVVYLVNTLLTLVTLGIYQFWAKTKIRHYLWGHSALGEDSFAYHGTGKELFLGWLKFILLILVIVAGITGLHMNYGPEVGKAAEGLLGLFFFFMYPALMVGAWRYRMSRTSMRNVRFSFRGDKKTATPLYLKGILLSACTLGLYIPYHKMNMNAFWRNHSWYGNIPFRFTGQGKDVFKKFFTGWLVTIFTLGLGSLYWLWVKAYMERYTWENTHISYGQFQFSAKGEDYLKLYLVNMLLLIVTLGLAFPWVKVRNMKFMAKHLSLQGDIDLDRVMQEMKESGALSEGASDALDVAVDVL